MPSCALGEYTLGETGHRSKIACTCGLWKATLWNIGNTLIRSWLTRSSYWPMDEELALLRQIRLVVMPPLRVIAYA